MSRDSNVTAHTSKYGFSTEQWPPTRLCIKEIACSQSACAVISNQKQKDQDEAKQLATRTQSLPPLAQPRATYFHLSQCKS